jgi:hypothetical protein
MPKTLRIKAREYGEQQLEALKLPARLDLELDDGSIVSVAHPWLWDDATEAAVQEASKDADEPYNTRYARAVLGKKEHARFLKGGGQSTQVALAVAMMKRGELPAGDDSEDAADPKGSPSRRS